MVNKTKTAAPVEVIPSVQGGISAIASSNAPVIFFDNFANHGTYNGIAHLTLVVMRFMPGSDNSLAQDNAIVAHLRMNLAALAALKNSIIEIENMLKVPENQLAN